MVSAATVRELGRAASLPPRIQERGFVGKGGSALAASVISGFGLFQLCTCRAVLHPILTNYSDIVLVDDPAVFRTMFVLNYCIQD